MDDPALIRVLERVSDLPRNPHSLIDGNRPSLDSILEPAFPPALSQGHEWCRSLLVRKS